VPQDAPCHVGGDAVQPSAEVAPVPQPVEPQERLQRRLLGGVLRVAARTEEALAEP
jgi:hypothetical protein